MDCNLVLNPTARVSLHYPPSFYNNRSFIARELLSQPPFFVVCSHQMPSVFNRAYSLVLFDADNGYLHWLVVNQSTSHMEPVVDYMPPDTQLPGRDGLIRRLGIAVLDQGRRVFSAAEIFEITNSVRSVSPFNFSLLGFAEQHRLPLVGCSIMYYSALAVYQGGNGVQFLAAAEGVVTPIEPYAPYIQHFYLPTLRWGSFSLSESVYRIARIGEANSVTPGGRFMITYPTAWGRQPAILSYPVQHVRYTEQTVAAYFDQYIDSLPFQLRPALD